MDEKQRYRDRVWALLERENVARFPGARGRIPNFAGAKEAADRLAALPEWSKAKVLKANPDSPQLPVRARALADGKVLYMAVPRLRERRPFLLLDHARLGASPRAAASISGATRLGRPVPLSSMRPVDLVVCGSVAVNRQGARIGKGGGYSDLEFALLTEAGLLRDGTVIATTVHPLQVFDEDLPEADHDFRLDLIVTPEESLPVAGTSRRRPPGIMWSHLTRDQIQAVPVLAELAIHRE